MRKVIILMSTVCLLLSVASCADAKEEKENMESSKTANVCDIDCESADMSEYETMLEENHVFNEVSFAQSNELLKSEDFTGIIYYGYPACPWCVEAVPIMNEVAKDYNLQIYYVNKKSQENINHPEEEEKAIQILDAAYGLDKDKESEKPRLYVPEVVVVKEGEVLSHHMGTVKNHNAHERVMSEDEQRILKTIYENMFLEIQE